MNTPGLSPPSLTCSPKTANAAAFSGAMSAATLRRSNANALARGRRIAYCIAAFSASCPLVFTRRARTAALNTYDAAATSTAPSSCSHTPSLRRSPSNPATCAGSHQVPQHPGSAYAAVTAATAPPSGP